MHTIVSQGSYKDAYLNAVEVLARSPGSTSCRLSVLHEGAYDSTIFTNALFERCPAIQRCYDLTKRNAQ